MNGLRSVQYGSDQEYEKRAEDKDGGVVVDYHWQSLSETAYDSFHSTQSLIKDFSGDIVADMQDANTILSCADFADSDGYLNSGVVSIGWHGSAYKFGNGEENADINECELV